MKSTNEIKEKIENIFSKIPSSSDIDHEVYYVESETKSLAWSDGKPSLNEVSISEGVCLRVLEKGHQGMITTVGGDLDASSKWEEKKQQCLEVARATPADGHRHFCRLTQPPSWPEWREPLSISANIPTIFSQLEKKVLALDSRIKKVIKFHWNERNRLKGLRGSHCQTLVEGQSMASFTAEILAQDQSGTEVAWDFKASRYPGDISFEELALATAEHAVQSLGGKPISSGKYAVVVHPRVGTQLLGLVTQALSAEGVQRKRSFWAGLKGQTVASPLIGLVDDPTLLSGVASGLIDDEGTPHQCQSMVVDGMLEDYFYDLRTASVEGRESNGHGMKESLGALPRPAATNFYMKPGITSVEQMLGAEAQVFLLKEVMGLHMADPITGEFSLGASGFLYERGRPKKAVRGVTIAGTVPAMLKEVSAVGPDLTWLGSIGAPSFYIPSMTIAGN
ncbi:MAG: hypothetical protein KCHDKBKB_00814 [Elusimicrobia bacterium]|nr:hypothetical protein [Elusimicrobiota bacterium]